jgi:hypothetical protein
MAAKKKKKRLTPREKQLVEGVMKTGVVQKAAKMTDPPYSQTGAHFAFKRIMESMPEIGQEMEESDLLHRKKLLGYLAELCCATKPIGYLGAYILKKDGGMEKVAPEEVVSNDFLEWPDWSNRAKGLQLAFKLRGELIDRVQTETKSNRQELIVKISAIMKAQGRSWAAIRKHLESMGAEVPAATPDWWKEL